MRSVEELERLWQAAPRPPRGRGTVRLICVRKGHGVHERPARVAVTVEDGVAGDRWCRDAAPKLGQQVTLMCARVAALVAGDGAPIEAAGDNFLVELDLSEAALPPGTRLRLGTAVLEVTPLPHTACRKFRDRFGPDAAAWVNQGGARRLRGVNCRVVAAGEVAVGDPIEVLPAEPLPR
jgi:MOSC domain-containing protein YiiM